jgi:hypothetical protein
MQLLQVKVQAIAAPRAPGDFQSEFGKLSTRKRKKGLRWITSDDIMITVS